MIGRHDAAWQPNHVKILKISLFLVEAILEIISYQTHASRMTQSYSRIVVQTELASCHLRNPPYQGLTHLLMEIKLSLFLNYCSSIVQN